MMHDLQLPTELAPSDEAVRRFRASTVEEAMAAAASELGPSVHIVEANRIRRGGVGGFFATDLGVELVATHAAIAQDRSSLIAPDVKQGGAVPAALGRRPQFDNSFPVSDRRASDRLMAGATTRTDQTADGSPTSALTFDGLDRLIADVGRSERESSQLDQHPDRHPDQHPDQHGPPKVTSFADHLQRETELPTEQIVLPLARREPLSTRPQEPIEPPSRSYAALLRYADETGWGERPDLIDLDQVHLAWTELVESIEAKSEVTSKREWAAATAAKLRQRAVPADQRTDVATTPLTPTPTRTPTRTTIRKPTPKPIPQRAIAAADSPTSTIDFAARPGSNRPEDLVASATAHIFEQLAALDTRSGGKLDCLRSLRVAVTMPDGANIEVTADLSLMAGDRA